MMQLCDDVMNNHIMIGKRPNSSMRENVTREQKNEMEPFWTFPCKAHKTVKNA